MKTCHCAHLLFTFLFIFGLSYLSSSCALAQATTPPPQLNQIYDQLSIVPVANSNIANDTNNYLAEGSNSGEVQGLDDVVNGAKAVGTLMGKGMNIMFGIDKLVENAGKLIGDLFSMITHFGLMSLVDENNAKGLIDGDPNQLKVENYMSGGGLLGAIGGATTAIYLEPPTMNLATVAKDTLANNIITSPAYAASAETRGSKFYHGVRAAWGQMLQFSLGIALVVIILAGFMIMFAGLDEAFPFLKSFGLKNNTSLAQVIPGIFTALFMAVFSLAIAALVMDLVNLIGTIIIVQFQGASGTENWFDSMIGLIKGGGNNWDEMRVGPLLVFRMIAWPAIQSFATSASLSWLTMGLIGGPGAGLANPATWVELTLLVIILLLVLKASIGICLALVKKYVILYLLVMFAPIILILSAIPGRQHMAFDWLRSIIVNSAVFPAILVFVSIANFIITDMADAEIGDPISAGTGLPLGGLFGGRFLVALVTFAFLHVTEKIPEFIDDRWGVKPMSLLADFDKRMDEVVKDTQKAMPRNVGEVPVVSHLGSKLGGSDRIPDWAKKVGRTVGKVPTFGGGEGMAVTNKYISQVPGGVEVVDAALSTPKIGVKIEDRLRGMAETERDRRTKFERSHDRLGSILKQANEGLEAKDKLDEEIAKTIQKAAELGNVITADEAREEIVARNIEQSLSNWQKGMIPDRIKKEVFGNDPYRYAQAQLARKQWGPLSKSVEAVNKYRTEADAEHTRAVDMRDIAQAAAPAGIILPDPPAAHTFAPPVLQRANKMQMRENILRDAIPAVQKYMQYYTGEWIDRETVAQNYIPQALIQTFRLAATGSGGALAVPTDPARPEATKVAVEPTLDPAVFATKYGNDPTAYAKAQLLMLGYSQEQFNKALSDLATNPQMMRVIQPKRLNIKPPRAVS